MRCLKVIGIALIVPLVFLLPSCGRKEARVASTKEEKPKIPQEVLSLLDKMEKAMSKVQTIEYTSRITLTFRGKKAVQKRESVAHVWMQKPSSFRTEATQEGKKTFLFVCDGKDISVLYYQPNQYEIFPASPQNIEKATGFTLLSFVLTKGLKERLLVGVVDAKLQEDKINNKPYLLLLLHGKEKETLCIWVDKGTFLPSRTEVRLGSSILQEEVQNPKIDKPLPSTLFLFTPPKDARRGGVRF